MSSPSFLPLVAGRCIPRVDGALEFGDEIIKNVDQEDINSEILTKASYYLAKFYKTKEVKKHNMNNGAITAAAATVVSCYCFNSLLISFILTY